MGTPPLNIKRDELWSLYRLLTFLVTTRFELLDTVNHGFIVQKTLLFSYIPIFSGRWKGDITNLSDNNNYNRADSRLNLKWLTEFKPIHNTPSFRPSCFPISKFRRLTGVQLTFVLLELIIYSKTDLLTGIEMLRIYKIYILMGKTQCFPS